jgi:hypothetical protein
MLPLISILVGAIFLVTFSLMLWVMLARSTKWARFTEKEHDFWVKRGMPVQWAGFIREFDRSLVAKVLVALTVIFAVGL